jgi:Tat protein secretion system quality control protein TatD with DNase activity
MFSSDAFAEATIPIIDAHSQLPSPGTADDVIRLMDEAMVNRTILSFRGSARGRDVLRLAQNYPRRIIPAVKTKGGHWEPGDQTYYDKIEQQLATGRFRALGEVLYYHAAKGNVAPEYSVLPTAPQSVYLLSVARDNHWPLIVHIEFAALGPEKDVWMQRLEELLSSNPDINFPMIHMGQLEANDVERLLSIHPNIFFMVSHSNTVTINQSNQPWVNLFDGDQLKPEWKDLMLAYPDRFILNFDNVFEEHWGQYYLEQVKLWRQSLQQLPVDVAHAIAHQNAERLWHLPPATPAPGVN